MQIQFKKTIIKLNVSYLYLCVDYPRYTQFHLFLKPLLEFISIHKTWLTQEADAKSWSGLKHVQPKEGRKELAPREIKFRCRRLDTTIRERAGSSQVPREAQESERYPGLFFFVSFFSSSFLIRDVVAKSLRAMEETRADRSLPWEQ